jgi:hypothetical protein
MTRLIQHQPVWSTYLHEIGCYIETINEPFDVSIQKKSNFADFYRAFFEQALLEQARNEARHRSRLQFYYLRLAERM